MYEAELIEAVREMHTGMTAVIGRLAGRMANDVLAVETQPIPAEGYLTREFGVPIGAVKIVNLGAQRMTVHAAGPGGQAPTNGVGVAVVPAGAHDVIPVAGHQFTIYGTAGDSATFHVFAGAVRPSAV